MKTFQIFVEESVPTKLIGLFVDVFLGSEAQIKEEEMINIQTDIIGFIGQIRRGKKLVQGRISFNRLGVIETSFFQGKISGGGWCLPENHNEFRQQLIEKTKKSLDEIVERIEITKNSLV